jgi:hypothetical protein
MERRYAMNEVKLVFNVANGECIGVDPPPDKAGNPRPRIAPDDAADIPDAAELSPDKVVLIDKKDYSICCIIHGGRLYCWC